MLRRRTKVARQTSKPSLANRKARGSGHERLPEILAAAKTLFAERGVENVTTRDIARRVGISQAALFTYYQNKDEILVRVMEAAFGQLAQLLASIESEASDPIDWIRRLIRGYVAFGLRYPDEYRLAFMLIKARRKPAERDRPGLIQAIIYPLFERVARKVSEAVKAGSFRDDLGPPVLVAQTLWSAMHGLPALLIARPRPHFPWEDQNALIQALTELVLGGLLSKRGAATCT